MATTLRGFAVAGFAALVLITWATGASAANIPIGTCAPLTASGNTYVLTADVGTSFCPCFLVAADGITLDLNGHTVSGSCTGISDGGGARSGTIVKNSGSPAGGVSNNTEFGIDLHASSRTQILNVAVTNNGGDGIAVGSSSLVKNCVVTGNGHDGIVLADRGQVQGCDVGAYGGGGGGNGGNGISAGDHALITQNDVQHNGVAGIFVGAFSTVTFNTVSKNTNDGIFADHHTQITGNTANQNGTPGVAEFNSGIECAPDGPAADTAFCTVTFNTANNNADEGIEVGGHSLVTGNLTNNNGDTGIKVNCPGLTPSQSNGAVTNNSSSGNSGGGDNYSISPGCFQNNNK